MVAAAVAGKLAGAPVVSSHRSPGTTYGKVLRKLDRLIGGAGGYARIICVSRAVAASFDDYPGAYREKLCVVHNGLEGDRPRIGRQAARAAFGLNEDDLAYVAVGRLQSQKNYPYFLDQFAKTRTGTLLIAGAGPEREAIEAQLTALGIRDRVRLLGDLPRTRVAALLEAGDVFVQPSLFEGQSNAVLEAMDAGLPVVLSDIPEQRETIEDDNGALCGVLVPLNDPAAWTQALDRLAQDRDLGQQLGQAAKALADRRYTVDQMAAGFERHLASAVGPVA
jgi:glycosyltransferase involved in cell wall biosynthesis